MGDRRDSLAERFPRLVHCRVSGFGADGPYGGRSGYDAAVQALTGIMSVHGERGGEPLRVGLPVVDMVTGLNAAIGILLALQERQGSGKGQFVETTLYDCGVSLLHPHLANFHLDGKVRGPSGSAHPNITPYDAYATATGKLFLAVGNDRQFDALCRLLDRSDLPSDERFASNAARNVNRDALKAAIEAALSVRDCSEISEALLAAGVPCGPEALYRPGGQRSPYDRARHGRRYRRLPRYGKSYKTVANTGQLSAGAAALRGACRGHLGLISAVTPLLPTIRNIS